MTLQKEISFQQFLDVDIRVGTIVEARVFEQARNPAYILHVDFGDDIGIKKSSAQITALYEAEDLIGVQVMAVVNFPSKQIGPIRSEVLVLGVSNQDGDIILVRPDIHAPNGARLH